LINVKRFKEVLTLNEYKMKNDILLLESLKKFYSDSENGEILRSILLGGKKISLRSIDWFITNYSKKNNICYLLYETDTTNFSRSKKNNKFHLGLNVYHSYKSQLKAYSKKRFDPFCRRDRINFPINDYEIETTIGQLNFFKWAIKNLVIDYIVENKKDIENDMNDSIKKNKESIKDRGERKKRQELSLSATRGLNHNRVPIQLDFN